MNITNRIGIFAGILSIFLLSTAMAETRYVTDVLEITVRTGKSTDHKIIAMIESGQRVNVLQDDREWAFVRLADGKEGWVLTRYLTRSEPNQRVLERLQKKHETLTEQVNALTEENKFLKEENRVLKSDLDFQKDSLNEMSSDYQTLKEESAEYMDLKDSERQARSRMQELDGKVEILEKEASRLRMQQNIRWFLAGSGVLLAGFVIGTISKRKRRRSSLLQ